MDDLDIEGLLMVGTIDKRVYPDTMNVAEARAKLKELIKKPPATICPCCSRPALIHRWSLYGTAARALMIFVYELGATEKFVHSKELKRFSAGQGDCSRLSHWGLAVEENERRPDGGKSGWWMVTPFGAAFADESTGTTIPKTAYVYAGVCLKVSGPPVGIRQALGTKFNYEAMVRGEF